jgi:hypothetical protein
MSNPLDELRVLVPSEASPEVASSIELVGDHRLRVGVEERTHKAVAGTAVAHEHAVRLDVGKALPLTEPTDQ